jgi:hypothetical protein
MGNVAPLTLDLCIYEWNRKCSTSLKPGKGTTAYSVQVTLPFCIFYSQSTLLEMLQNSFVVALDKKDKWWVKPLCISDKNII